MQCHHGFAFRYEGQFAQWKCQLLNGFNVLCYGFGSKKQLLTDFGEKMLADYNYFVVNGYYPSLNVKQVSNHYCGYNVSSHCYLLN